MSNVEETRRRHGAAFCFGHRDGDEAFLDEVYYEGTRGINYPPCSICLPRPVRTKPHDVVENSEPTQLQRLEALEKVVSDHLAEHRKAENTIIRSHPPFSYARFDPDRQSPPEPPVISFFNGICYTADQSPKGVPFEVALAYLKTGRKVARRAGGWDVSATTNVLVDHLRTDGPVILKYRYRTDTAIIWTPNPHDLLGRDWEIIPEP